MSWSAYVDQLLTGVPDEVAICGYDGSVWATSPGLNMSAEQILVLAGKKEVIQTNGAMVGEKKCRLLNDERENEQSFCMMLKASKDHGANNVCVGYSKTVIVIAVGPPAGPVMTSDVFRIVDYLRKTNM